MPRAALGDSGKRAARRAGVSTAVGDGGERGEGSARRAARDPAMAEVDMCIFRWQRGGLGVARPARAGVPARKKEEQNPEDKSKKPPVVDDRGLVHEPNFWLLATTDLGRYTTVAPIGKVSVESVGHDETCIAISLA